MVTKSMRVIGHGSLPFDQIPADLFADGWVSGAFPFGILQKTEEVRSFSQNACTNRKSMVKGQRLCGKPQKMLCGRPQKKRAVSKIRFEINAKHAILTTNHQCISLTMRMHKRILVEVFFCIPVLLILVGASTLALSLTVRSIISSFVSQAILSIFSGHVL